MQTPNATELDSVELESNEPADVSRSETASKLSAPANVGAPGGGS